MSESLADVNVVLGALLATQVFTVGFFMQRLDIVFEQAVSRAETTAEDIRTKDVADIAELDEVEGMSVALDAEHRLDGARSLVGLPWAAAAIVYAGGMRLADQGTWPWQWIARISPRPDRWQPEPTGLTMMFAVTTYLAVLAVRRSRQRRQALARRLARLGIEAVHEAKALVTARGVTGATDQADLKTIELDRDDQHVTTLSNLDRAFPGWHWTHGTHAAYWHVRCMSLLELAGLLRKWAFEPGLAPSVAKAMRDMATSVLAESEGTWVKARKRGEQAMLAAPPNKGGTHCLYQADLLLTGGDRGWLPRDQSVRDALTYCELAAESEAPALRYRAVYLWAYILKNQHRQAADAAAAAAGKPGVNALRTAANDLGRELDVLLDKHVDLQGSDNDLVLLRQEWRAEQGSVQRLAAIPTVVALLRPIAALLRAAADDAEVLEISARVVAPLDFLSTVRAAVPAGEFQRLVDDLVPLVDADADAVTCRAERRRLRRDPHSDAATLIQALYAFKLIDREHPHRARLSLLLHPVRERRRPVSDLIGVALDPARERLAALGATLMGFGTGSVTSLQRAIRWTVLLAEPLFDEWRK